MIQTQTQTPTRPQEATELPLVLKLKPVIHLTEDQFFAFCGLNDDLRIERTPQGELLIMPPTGGYTGNREIDITTQVHNWAVSDGTGIAFSSSTGFILPNNAVRSPDASLVLKSRLNQLTHDQKDRFIPLCPDFVLEIRSPSDRLSLLQSKMAEYIANGTQLGFLLDPANTQAFIYRPHKPTETLQNPYTISGEPEMQGFTLNLKHIWHPLF